MNLNEMSGVNVKDVVVVGSGGCGLAAALTLAEGGAKVVVFEKMPIPGGVTNFAEGTYAVESEQQFKRNIKATRDEGFRELMNYSHWKANALLVRAIVNKSGDTISWLENHGVPFIGPAADYFGGPMVWHLFNGFGNVMIKALMGQVVAKGVEVHFEITVKKLIRTGIGPITGVVVEDKEGKQIEVRAKAVIVATGGFANNKKWIKKYTGLELGENIYAPPFKKMGDGISMAWGVGAAEEGADVMLHMTGGPLGRVKPQQDMLGLMLQPTLWINRDGIRFCDEGIVANMIHTGNVLSKQPGSYCFKILDADYMKTLMEQGGLGNAHYSAPRKRLTKLDTEIKALVKKGDPFVCAADTLEELAEKMGVDRATFANTVAEYNANCSKGRDDQFGKDPSHLRPVQTPQFYAFKCYPEILCTLGGIKINQKTEVIDKEGRVIPGLYAGGNDAGGMYGDSYDLTASGIASAFAVNSGRIAAENALKYVEKT